MSEQLPKQPPTDFDAMSPEEIGAHFDQNYGLNVEAEVTGRPGITTEQQQMIDAHQEEIDEGLEQRRRGLERRQERKQLLVDDIGQEAYDKEFAGNEFVDPDAWMKLQLGVDPNATFGDAPDWARNMRTEEERKRSYFDRVRVQSDLLRMVGKDAYMRNYAGNPDTDPEAYLKSQENEPKLEGILKVDDKGNLQHDGGYQLKDGERVALESKITREQAELIRSHQDQIQQGAKLLEFRRKDDEKLMRKYNLTAEQLQDILDRGGLWRMIRDHMNEHPEAWGNVPNKGTEHKPRPNSEPLNWEASKKADEEFEKHLGKRRDKRNRRLGRTALNRSMFTLAG